MPTQPYLSLPVPAQRFLAEANARRGPLALFVGTVAVAAVVISLFLPKWYAAQCTLLPPAEGGDALGLMGAMIENKTLGRLGLFSSTTPSDIYVEILRSRTLRESLVRAFDLQRLYRQKMMDNALKELDQHVKVGVSPVGVVTVAVEDRDPKRAADMANHLIEDLDRFNLESVNTRAKRTRIFLEQRLVEARERLTHAESTVTAYEQRNKVVASSDAIGGMADVISRKMNLEVTRSYMSSYTRPGSAGLTQVDAEINAVNHEISKLPTLKQEGARLALDAEIQRRLFTLLTTEYEEMRIQETRDTPTITVLDPARPPDLRSRPRRAVLVAGAALVAGLLGAAWVALSMRPPAEE
ncbi:MAG: hypothetical protein HYR74_11430 [Candidatus Eisenbacteria bacterium]|nr:hypothetical protein [Candidatus Eisenbacteria bacterium]